RDKDLIISGGLNVYPKEIESVIDDIDGVAESAVIGVPHRDFGEAVVAIIVPKGDSLSDEIIKEHLTEKLAKFKQPKEMIYADQLPRNAMGKVQKAELRKLHAELFMGK
ncbi:MAG: AMP-binding enzyme, partial [Candidatus Puniceispirillales bacterium]